MNLYNQITNEDKQVHLLIMNFDNYVQNISKRLLF